MHERCPHGQVIGISRMEGIAWAGPVGKCRCCSSHYGFIDSWSYTGGMPSELYDEERVSHDRTLCFECGGKPAIREVRDGVVVRDEPGSAQSGS